MWRILWVLKWRWEQREGQNSKFWSSAKDQNYYWNFFIAVWLFLNHIEIHTFSVYFWILFEWKCRWVKPQSCDPWKSRMVIKEPLSNQHEKAHLLDHIFWGQEIIIMYEDLEMSASLFYVFLYMVSNIFFKNYERNTLMLDTL